MDKNYFGLPIDELFDFDNNGNLDPFEKAIETGVITEDFDDDEDFEDFDDF